jgi:hypothetical protein
MEVNNRFELLASLSVDEEPIESSFNDITSSKQKQNINVENSTKNYWEIPEYIEKHIPCSPIFITKVETSLPVKKVKPPVNIIKCEEQQDETTPPPTIEVQNQPTTYSYYPPQPYKFKQTPSSEYYFHYFYQIISN